MGGRPLLPLRVILIGGHDKSDEWQPTRQRFSLVSRQR